MGWWQITEDGSAKHFKDESDSGLRMGDNPADIMDAALRNIIREYQKAFGRNPCQREIKACFDFSFSTFAENLEK